MYKLTVIVLLLTTQLSAVTESVKSGKWGVASTWSTGKVPSALDSVLVSEKNEVSLSQMKNECALLTVKGKLLCLSPGRELICNKILLLDSGQFSSNVLGAVVVNEIRAKGTGIIEGFNLKVKSLFSVEKEINFYRTSGKIEIQNLIVGSKGVWNVPQNQSFLISGWFENNGDFDSGTGNYSFLGTNVLRGSNEISMHSVAFTDSLINQNRLQVLESITAPDSAVFINDSAGALVIKTTDANFKIKQLNLSATGNSLVLSRGTKQTLPASINNEYQQVLIAGGGQLVIDSIIQLNQDLLIDSSSTLSLNADISTNVNSGLIMNQHAVLKYNIKTATSLNRLSNSFNSFQLDSNSTISVFSNVDFILPVLDYASLKLSTDEAITVDCQGSQVIRGDLQLGKNVRLVLNQKKFAIKGDGIGPGIFSAVNASVEYCGKKGQKILPSDYDTLILNNTSKDTCSAGSKFNVNVFFVEQGTVKVGALKIDSLVVDSLCEMLVGPGEFGILSSLINKGIFTISSNNSRCTFKGSLLNSGLFRNMSSSSHTLNADINNTGIFNGCLGTACTWKVENNINIKGASIVYLPRVESMNNDTIFNAGHLNIASSIKGNGSLINLPNSILVLGMNSGQNDFSINAWEHPLNTIVFDRSGDQLIHTVDKSVFQNLSIANSGIKSMPQDIQVQGNLTVDSNATFNIDSNNLVVKTSSSLYLKPNSAMVIGNSLSQYPTIFPSHFQKNKLFIDKTSTISYESSGDQTISAVPQYGNLIIKDGAEVQSIKTVGTGDSLVVHGFLNITESSIEFVANSKVVEIKGDWEGPGNNRVNLGALVLHGNLNCTGKLHLGVTPVHYVGLGDQHMKNTEYHDLYVNKQSGVASVDAGAGTFLVNNSMYINNGMVTVGGEYFEIQGSLIVDDSLKFESRAQRKLLNNVVVQSSGVIDNSYGINITVGGDIRVTGVWKNGNRSIVNMNSATNQSVSNFGQLSFDKLALSADSTNKTITVSGGFLINDTLLLQKTSLSLNSALISMRENGMLVGETESNQVLGVGNSMINTTVAFDSTNNENVAGLGYSVYSNSPLGKGVLTRGFNDRSLPTNELSVKKSYLLELFDSSHVHYQCAIKYNDYEVTNHDESLLTIYYDNNYSNAFRVGLSSLHSQFNMVSYSGIQTGTKVTLGRLDTNPLPVQLISFSASLHFATNGTETAKLSWVVGSEVNTKKYLLYVSEDAQSFTFLKSIDWKKGTSSFNKYTFDYPIKSNSKQLYYKLYEKDLFDGVHYLGLQVVQRNAVVSTVTINGRPINVNGVPFGSSLTLYTLNGQKVASSSNMDLKTEVDLRSTIFVLCSKGPDQQNCEKIYLK